MVLRYTIKTIAISLVLCVCWVGLSWTGLGPDGSVGTSAPRVNSAHAQSTPPDPVPLARTGDCFADNIYYGAVPPGGENGRVLVFVHGYNGLATDWFTNATSGGFNDMYILAYNAGYRTAFVNVNINFGNPPPQNRCLITRRTTSFDMLNNGAVLSQQINAIREHYDVYQVDLIAHSKGGTDAQTAAVWFGAWRYVRNIFTLATPHQGSLLADLLWTPEGRELTVFNGNRDRATLTMRTGIMQLYRLLTDQAKSDDNIKYYSGAGNLWDVEGSFFQITGAWLQERPAGGDNDGIVTVASTILPYAQGLFLEPWTHSETSTGHNAFPYIHQRLRADVIAPGSVQLVGPSTGTLGRTYEFAAYLPATTTIPLDYTWRATGQVDAHSDEERTSNKIEYAWDTPGRKVVTVAASNEKGTASATHEITIIPLTAPSAVTLGGETQGDVDITYRFEATLPEYVSTPVTYAWHATDQVTIQKSGNTIDGIELTWTTAGRKEIQLVVSNEAGSFTVNHTIRIGTPTSLDPQPFPEDSLDNRLYLAQVSGNALPSAQAIAHMSATEQEDWQTSNTILRGGEVAQSVVEVIPVEAGANRVQFMLVTSHPDVQGELVGPTGTIYPMTAVTSSPSSVFSNLTTFSRQVQADLAGEWQIKIASPEPAGYLLVVMLDTPLMVFMEGVPQSPLTPGDALQFNVIGSTASVAAVLHQVRATINYPPGLEPPAGSASATADGAITASGPTLNMTVPKATGMYQIGVNVQGEIDGSRFERSFTAPLVVLADDFTLSVNSLKGLLEQWYCESSDCTVLP